MAFVAVDKNGSEYIYKHYPQKDLKFNVYRGFDDEDMELPSGTIKKLIGRDLIFDDDPVELT